MEPPIGPYPFGSVFSANYSNNQYASMANQIQPVQHIGHIPNFSFYNTAPFGNARPPPMQSVLVQPARFIIQSPEQSEAGRILCPMSIADVSHQNSLGHNAHGLLPLQGYTILPLHNEGVKADSELSPTYSLMGGHEKAKSLVPFQPEQAAEKGTLIGGEKSVTEENGQAERNNPDVDTENEIVDVEDVSFGEKIPYEKRATKCPFCERVCSNPSNLRQHARRMHGEKAQLEERLMEATAIKVANGVSKRKRSENVLKDMNDRRMDVWKMKARFSFKKVNPISDNVPYEKRLTICPICDKVCSNPSNARQHARRIHGIDKNFILKPTLRKVDDDGVQDPDRVKVVNDEQKDEEQPVDLSASNERTEALPLDLSTKGARTE